MSAPRQMKDDQWVFERNIGINGFEREIKQAIIDVLPDGVDLCTIWKRSIYIDLYDQYTLGVQDGTTLSRIAYYYRIIKRVVDHWLIQHWLKDSQKYNINV